MDLEEEDAEMEKSKKVSVPNVLVQKETTLGLVPTLATQKSDWFLALSNCTA